MSTSGPQALTEAVERHVVGFLNVPNVLDRQHRLKLLPTAFAESRNHHHVTRAAGWHALVLLPPADLYPYEPRVESGDAYLQAFFVAQVPLFRHREGHDEA